MREKEVDKLQEERIAQRKALAEQRALRAEKRRIRSPGNQTDDSLSNDENEADPVVKRPAANRVSRRSDERYIKIKNKIR